MLSAYIPIAIFVAVATGFALFTLVFSSLLHSEKYNKVKLEPYECGIEPVTDARDRYSIRYYLVARRRRPGGRRGARTRPPKSGKPRRRRPGRRPVNPVQPRALSRRLKTPPPLLPQLRRASPERRRRPSPPPPPLARLRHPRLQ